MSIPNQLCPLGTKGNLPPGYTPLDFLFAPQAGVGIDLNYVPTESTGFSTDFEIFIGRQYQHVLSAAELYYDAAGTLRSKAVIFTPHYNGAAYDSFTAKYVTAADAWSWYNFGAIINVRSQAFFNWKNDSMVKMSNGQSTEMPQGLVQREGVQTWLFALPMDANQSMLGRVYAAAISEGARIVRNYVPAIDREGRCCMFDAIARRTYHNSLSGTIAAGVGTVAQLTTLLRRLPATGGELTLSLPAEANTPEVAEAMQACHDTKGWTLTVHEYRPAAVATYSLRRVREIVWCRKVPCEHGSYVDSIGTRWQVERCAAIFGPHGQDPTAYGYEPFDSEEQATEEWELKEDTVPLPQSE